MTANHFKSHTAYRDSGVDTDEADRGLNKLVDRIKRNWLPPGDFGGVQLPIGYFANVVNIGDGKGLAICTDGVGTKAIIAKMMHKYDTIGVDCVAMNVNDLICLGVQPLTFVDYIAVDRDNLHLLDEIAVGLARGADEAGVSISGGETAQLEDIVRGFDLAGTAAGIVSLDKIITGRDLEPDDLVIGIQSNGIHSNGLTLARKAFFKSARPLSLDFPVPESNISLGEELLRPTLIYVREVMDILKQVPNVKALVNITSDGLLNLCRVHNPKVGFLIEDMPETPTIFKMIQEYGHVSTAEMFQVYNMGVGFCVVASEGDISAIFSILRRHNRKAWVIGRVTEDPTNGVELPRQGLVGHGKRFQQK
jgi:phosphoribosylformylglycinamidine cyclo-ligase